MKKQLFIFVFLAFFAGIINVSAQDCDPGALSPVAGQPYNYSVTIGGAGYNGATGSYTWYVTTNVDLLSGTGVVPNDGSMFATVTNYNTPTVGFNPLTLTWTSAATSGGQTFYLVVKYSQANSTASPSCTAMNMKVWEIKPINKFLLAINSFAGAVGQSGVYCFADVTGAVVTPGASPTVQYTYGNNTLFAEITPSFYSGQWTPSFQIGTVTGDQVVTSVTWDTSPTGTFSNTTTLTNAAGVYTATATGNATSSYDGSTKLYVKIVIANNNYEGLADQTINIAVDGIIPGATPLPDVVSDTDCTPAPDFHKNVDQTIKARPTINDDGTNTFIPKNP